MQITYFHRHPQAGFSIAKVFNTITTEIVKHHDIKQYYVPSHRSTPFSLLKNIYFIFKNRDKRGINHLTGDIHYGLLGLIGCKSVLTIHDMGVLDYPGNAIKKHIMKFLWITLPLLIADKVVCISEHTRTRLLTVTRRKDIEVVYNPIDPMFNFTPKSFNTLHPIVLHIGTTWNKNVVNTINAVAGLNCKLVIIGQVGNAVLNLLATQKISYAIKSGLTDEELLDEYVKCDIISFCSIYEGFGMPIIEGNAVGRCVITSALAPMTEIGAEAVLLIDPEDTLDMQNGFKKLMSNQMLRDELIANGKTNIIRFNPVNIAAQYLALYKSV